MDNIFKIVIGLLIVIVAAYIITSWTSKEKLPVQMATMGYYQVNEIIKNDDGIVHSVQTIWKPTDEKFREMFTDYIKRKQDEAEAKQKAALVESLQEQIKNQKDVVE